MHTPDLKAQLTAAEWDVMAVTKTIEACIRLGEAGNWHDGASVAAPATLAARRDAEAMRQMLVDVYLPRADDLQNKYFAERDNMSEALGL